ncbi:MAG: ferritin-like domain-containing protein [Acidimicrobiia bacterium]|nr:ferritin-like domain-containing protein [Acidimicrobiia bacterium]
MALEERIGREDVNDLDAILDVESPYADEVVHTVRDHAEAIFTWDYEKGQRPALEKLYEKAKGSQWNGETDLDWSIDVDHEGQVSRTWGREPAWDAMQVDVTGTPLEKWGSKEWVTWQMEQENWTLSQFMHGEQGALLCTAKIVETVPWIDAKYYAATQVMDEARHVEVFAEYLDTKLSGHYPLNAHLGRLLDDIIRRQPLGHDLSRHADHGRGSGARGVRAHAQHDPGTAPRAVAEVRDGRRGTACRLRRAEPP